MVRNGMQGGPGGLTAIHSSPMVPYINADLDKMGFRNDKDNTEIIFNVCKRHHIW